MPLSLLPAVRIPRPRKPKLTRVYRIKTKCLRASMQALQVEVGGRGEWVPRSGVHPASKVNGFGDEGELVLYAWAAKLKGWRA